MGEGSWFNHNQADTDRRRILVTGANGTEKNRKQQGTIAIYKKKPNVDRSRKPTNHKRTDNAQVSQTITITTTTAISTETLSNSTATQILRQCINTNAVTTDDTHPHKHMSCHEATKTFSSKNTIRKPRPQSSDTSDQHEPEGKQETFLRCCTDDPASRKTGRYFANTWKTRNNIELLPLIWT